MNQERAIVTMHCPDQAGIVAQVTEFVFKNQGNILTLEQHVDQEAGLFYMRVEWDLAQFALPWTKIEEYFKHLVADRLQMVFQLYFSSQRPRMGVFVSQYPHCLLDLLARWETGELNCDIPLVISNHDNLRPQVERLGIAFHHVPVTAATKAQAEARQQQLLDATGVGFVVLARYMQILSPAMVGRWPQRIINIHHSFLPAFTGAKPYHSAHERGVKIIGATSHYVTADLDQGPIIEQDVARVSHLDSVEHLVAKGRDLEKVVLARAVAKHLERKILVQGNRTIVFA